MHLTWIKFVIKHFIIIDGNIAWDICDPTPSYYLCKSSKQMKKMIKRSKTAKPQILLSVRHVVHYEQIGNSYWCTCELFAWNCKTRFKDLHTANFINFPRVKPGTDPEWSVSCVRSVCMQLMSLSLWKHWSGCIRQHGVCVCVSLKQAVW